MTTRRSVGPEPPYGDKAGDVLDKVAGEFTKMAQQSRDIRDGVTPRCWVCAKPYRPESQDSDLGKNVVCKRCRVIAYYVLLALLGIYCVARSY